MTKWYDRIGNEVKIKYFEGKTVVGKVIEGYRYKDGCVTIQLEDGSTAWCGTDYHGLQKTENTLPNLVTNGDRIRAMSDEELAQTIIKIMNDSVYECCTDFTSGCWENCKHLHDCEYDKSSMIGRWLKKEADAE